MYLHITEGEGGQVRMVEVAGHLALCWEAGTQVTQPGIYWKRRGKKGSGRKGKTEMEWVT